MGMAAGHDLDSKWSITCSKAANIVQLLMVADTADQQPEPAHPRHPSMTCTQSR